jgi:hypothetical protein
MTPFSGISLILHLAIIGIAKVYYYVTGEAETRPRKPLNADRGTTPFFNRAVSCVIVVAIFVMMLSSFTQAVTTSVREGSREPHIQYIKEKAASLKKVQWASILWPAEANDLDEPTNAPQLPNNGTSTYTLSN